MGWDEYIVTCVHHDSIIHCTFTVLNISVLCLFITPPTSILSFYNDVHLLMKPSLIYTNDLHILYIFFFTFMAPAFDVIFKNSVQPKIIKISPIFSSISCRVLACKFRSMANFYVWNEVRELN